MEIERVANVIREKHGIALDPDDPILLLATVADELHKEGQEEFARIASELSDHVAAALVLAETTAKARSERLITEAARWSAEHIRAAGTDVAAAVERFDGLLAQSRRSARMVAIAIGVAVSLAIGAACAFGGWWWRGDPSTLQCADQTDGSRVCWMYERLPTPKH
jgi:hypothetical protein